MRDNGEQGMKIWEASPYYKVTEITQCYKDAIKRLQKREKQSFTHAGGEIWPYGRVHKQHTPINTHTDVIASINFFPCVPTDVSFCFHSSSINHTHLSPNDTFLHQSHHSIFIHLQKSITLLYELLWKDAHIDFFQ